MGALAGRDGGGDGRPVHGRQFPRRRGAEVHPHRALVRAGRPRGPATDVLSRYNAWQRYGHAPGAIKTGVLCQERCRQLGITVDSSVLSYLSTVMKTVRNDPKRSKLFLFIYFVMKMNYNDILVIKDTKIMKTVMK